MVKRAARTDFACSNLMGDASAEALTPTSPCQAAEYAGRQVARVRRQVQIGLGSRAAGLPDWFSGFQGVLHPAHLPGG